MIKAVLSPKKGLLPGMAALALLLFSGLSASAQASYERLQLKADRFFDQHEWTQAAATYYQMIEQRPDVPATYGKAIVANALKSDTVAEMALMVKALQAKVPFDSVLSRVRSTSFALGKSNLYGDFLHRVRVEYPWMRRPIDNYLLRYYTYRHDGEKMVQFSKLMLQGDPKNRGSLLSLAQGAMLCGDYEEGVQTYQRLLADNPKDYDALIALGNYYYLQGNDKAMALEYLERAQEIRATPYVQVLLDKLNPRHHHSHK